MLLIIHIVHVKLQQHYLLILAHYVAINYYEQQEKSGEPPGSSKSHRLFSVNRAKRTAILKRAAIPIARLDFLSSGAAAIATLQQSAPTY